jgi:hypothetical protein
MGQSHETHRNLKSVHQRQHHSASCGQKSFRLVKRCHQLLSEFLANGHLPQESRQSRLSANLKRDNELKPGSMHRSLGIYLMVDENSGNSQLGGLLQSDDVTSSYADS